MRKQKRRERGRAVVGGERERERGEAVSVKGWERGNHVRGVRWREMDRTGRGVGCWVHE